MLSIARDAQIVDISHSVRKFAIRDGAYLLWSAVPWLPVGVHVVVVDPGVGTDRLPIALRVARGDIFVGPDNGVLMPAAAALGGIVEARVLENRALMLPRTTATVHGRDVFAPIAGHLAKGRPFEEVGSLIAPGRLVGLEFPAPLAVDGGLETTVLFVDSFGNIRLFATPADLAAAAGPLQAGDPLVVEFPAQGERPAVRETVPWSRTFGDLPIGSPLLYLDSSGLLALAVNQGSAAGRMGIETGRRVRLHSGRP
jgi:hypothetical protein